MNAHDHVEDVLNESRHQIVSDSDEPLKPQRRKQTPLPALQLFIVYLIQFGEPVASQVIYPFINDLIRNIGVTHGDEAKVGYYAGIIVSSFSGSLALAHELPSTGICFLRCGSIDCIAMGSPLGSHWQEARPSHRLHCVGRIHAGIRSFYPLLDDPCQSHHPRSC